MEHLILLHGALGASAQLMPLAEKFSDFFQVHTLNFYGHGGNRISDNPYSIHQFAADVLRFLDEKNIEKVSVFGYSMGGYVGMYIAKHHPDRINKVVTLATKYDWNEQIAAKEVLMLNPAKIEAKLPAFAQTLNERFAPADWKIALQKTAEMMIALGADNTLKLIDYASVTTPALLLLGDRDKMVAVDETIAVFKALPNAQLCILPNTQHPIEQVDLTLLSTIILPFLTKK